MWTSKKSLGSAILLMFSSVASYDLPSLSNYDQVLPAPQLGTKPYIVGGKEASIKDYPYQVSFTVKDTYFCGGGIVSTDYIVTAAHCVQNVDPSTVVLRAGSSFRTNGTIIAIQNVTAHPKYDSPRFDHDVAVLKTLYPIQFTDVIQPIKLTPKGRPMVANTNVTVTGWGKTSYTANSIPEELRAVNIPVVDHRVCGVEYSVLTDNEWCGGNFLLGGQGTCQGDSGGIAIQDGLAVGIVSFGRGCGYPLSPSVFADLASEDNRGFITECTGL